MKTEPLSKEEVHFAFEDIFGVQVPVIDIKKMYPMYMMLISECKKYAEKGKSVRVKFSRSLSLYTSLQVEGSDFLITFPIGVYARMLVLLRNLVKYYHDQDGVHFDFSQLDNFEETLFKIPQEMKPVFGEYHEYEEDELVAFWMGLDDLNNLIFYDKRWDYDINCILEQIHLFMLYHELAHIEYGHYRILRDDALVSFFKSKNVSMENLRRGCENTADRHAAVHTMDFLWNAIVGRPQEKYLKTFDSCFNQFAFAMMVLFCSCDVNRKSLDLYKTGYYEHPSVRYNLSVTQVTQSLPEDVDGFDMQDLWARCEATALSKCQYAFNEVSRDYNLEYPIQGNYWSVSNSFHLTIMELTSNARHLSNNIQNLLVEFDSVTKV